MGSGPAPFRTEPDEQVLDQNRDPSEGSTGSRQPRDDGQHREHRPAGSASSMPASAPAVARSCPKNDEEHEAEGVQAGQQGPEPTGSPTASSPRCPRKTSNRMRSLL